jgi:outer membrane protein assembly factor BamB
MPVFLDGRIYLAGGGDIWWGKNEAWLKCIKANGTGDITKSNLVWSYTLDKHVLGTPAVWQGMIFIADCGRKFHCIDANTGQAIWTKDIAGEVWASPVVADGKVYLGTRSGAFYIFSASRSCRMLHSIELHDPISSTVAVANGTVYVATMSRLYAISNHSTSP